MERGGVGESVMKVILLLVAISALSPIKAESLKWLKRIGAVTVCAAAAFDAGTTFSAYSRDPGGHETNSLLADSHGKPSLWKFSLVKGLMCGGAIAASESRMPAVFALPLDGSLTIPQIVAGAKNMGVK